MTANTHYSITYMGDSARGTVDANVNTLDMTLTTHGKCSHYHEDSASVRPVDLLTVYFTQVDDEYPSPPESFTLTLDNSPGYKIKPIHEPSGCTATVYPAATPGKWILSITGPTADEISDFQLYTPGPTPPHKLKIRVKRQPSFSEANGPFDDVWGGEIT